MFEKRFCSKCGSENVKKNIKANIFFGAPQGWICVDCGFEDLEFPIKEELNKTKKKK